MENKGAFTKVLAIGGTALVWLPVVAPLTFGLVRLIQSGHVLFDYLMPAELAPLVLVGAGLLLWAAIRAKWRWQVLVWILGTAFVLLVGSQAVAMVTGLADGRIEATGWQWALTLGMLIGYDLAVVAMGVLGICLCKHVFNQNPVQREDIE